MGLKLLEDLIEDNKEKSPSELANIAIGYLKESIDEIERAIDKIVEEEPETPAIIVRCRTKFEQVIVLAVAGYMGYCWNDGDSFTEDESPGFEHTICYDLTNGFITEKEATHTALEYVLEALDDVLEPEEMSKIKSLRNALGTVLGHLG